MQPQNQRTDIPRGNVPGFGHLHDVQSPTDFGSCRRVPDNMRAISRAILVEPRAKARRISTVRIHDALLAPQESFPNLTGKRIVRRVVGDGSRHGECRSMQNFPCLEPDRTADV